MESDRTFLRNLSDRQHSPLGFLSGVVEVGDL
jgi:hypothetical protein